MDITNRKALRAITLRHTFRNSKTSRWRGVSELRAAKPPEHSLALLNFSKLTRRREEKPMMKKLIDDSAVPFCTRLLAGASVGFSAEGEPTAETEVNRGSSRRNR